MARKKRTGDIYAIKILDKNVMIRKNMVEHVMVERHIMANTHNPFVVKLYFAFQSEVSFVIIVHFLSERIHHHRH